MTFDVEEIPEKQHIGRHVFWRTAYTVKALADLDRTEFKESYRSDLATPSRWEGSEDEIGLSPLGTSFVVP